MGLTAEQLGFVRSGRPLYVDDGRLHFAVHPFLFSLADPRAQVGLCLMGQPALLLPQGQGVCRRHVL